MRSKETVRAPKGAPPQPRAPRVRTRPVEEMYLARTSVLLQRVQRAPQSLPPRVLAKLHGSVGNHAIGQMLRPSRGSTPRAGAILPEGLRAGAESLSGISMSDVRVHYNSPAPAQVNASAYARGADIHLAPGQERHLPHEAWHVVQQKQGRVAQTARLGNTPINDDGGLEREADVMGARALSRGSSWERAPGTEAVLRDVEVSGARSPVQRGGVFSTPSSDTTEDIESTESTATTDSKTTTESAKTEGPDEPEFVTVQVNLTNKGEENLAGHSSLEFQVSENEVVCVDSYLEQADYEMVTENLPKALAGKTNAKFNVTVSRQASFSGDGFFTTFAVPRAEALQMAKRADEWKGRQLRWNAQMNCTTPVKAVLNMRPGKLFNTPTGTLVQSMGRTPGGRAGKAVAFGVGAITAASVAYSNSKSSTSKPPTGSK